MISEDLNQLRQLEKKIGIQLEQVEYIDFWGIYNEYTVNIAGTILSLSLFSIDLEDISPLAKLQGLTSLSLFGNQIQDLSSLAQLQGLTQLNLGLNPILDLSPLSQLRGLNILNLRTIPTQDLSPLVQLQELTSIDLSGNLNQDFSPLGQLQGLTSLDYEESEIQDLSPLVQLQGLTNLNLRANQIQDLSPLAQLQRLTSLDIGENQIQDLSPLAQLQGLTSLHLSENQIQDLSPLAQLQGLTCLYLSGNQIQDLSPLAQLQGLTSLGLSGNQIQDLSPLAQLHGLTSLYLEGNQIQNIPQEVLRRKLKIELNNKGKVTGYINLTGNPIQSPPIEILRRGQPAISQWFDSQRGQKRELNEMKVILVGDGAAGKTSLVKRLFNEGFNPAEEQTHGIKIRKGSFTVGKRKIAMRFWDFGGQEIMHATHQFFLSHRSLYILVLDGRKEEKTEYWLKTIRSFGGDSPVLIVLNKMDQNPSFDVNQPFLRKKYGNISHFFRLSCKDKQGFKTFKKHLLKEVAQVKHIRTSWAENWFQVKSKLERLGSPYIDYTIYQKICREAGITEKQSRKTLVNFLHDLGTVLHFQDFILKETQILDPKWITAAVYRIINSSHLAASNGLLSLDSLTEILKPIEKEDAVYPSEKHGFVIELMKKFELCYSLNDKELLIPDLLPVAEPSFQFADKQPLNYRMQYDFLPPSIMPRFIVRRHVEIKDRRQWRTGVHLQHPESKTEAIVRSDNEARRIDIQIYGAGKREFLSVIRTALRNLNSTFKNLAVEEFLLLPDAPDVLVGYQELIVHEKMGMREILIAKLEKKYDVQSLLAGIESKEERFSSSQANGSPIEIRLRHESYTQVNVAIDVNLRTTLPQIQEEFAEFRKILLKSLPEQRGQMDVLTSGLDSISPNSSEEKINGALNPALRLLKQAADPKSDYNQAVKGGKKLLEHSEKAIALVQKIAPILGQAIGSFLG